MPWWTIRVSAEDTSDARTAATDLLEEAVTLGGAPDPESSLGYRAAWVGSSSPLAMLGVHRENRVTPWELTTVLQGRHARSGEQMRTPTLDRGRGATVASFGLTYSAPEEATREWLQGDARRKSAIEDALIASAEATLRHAWTTRRLVARLDPTGDRKTTFAYGLAGVAIVAAPSVHAADDQAKLRVHAVTVGVESPDGSLVTPVWEEMVGREPEFESIANTALTYELRPQATRSPQRVGREDVWILDPFDVERKAFGPYAQRVDDRATLYGEHFVERDDDWIESRRAEVGSPLNRFDSDRAAASLRAASERAEAQRRLDQAREDLHVLEGRYRDTLGDNAHVNVALQSQEEHVAQLERAVPEAEPDYIRDWLAENGSAVEEWIALHRERAVRDVSAQRGPAGHARRDSPANAKTIGRGAVERILADLRAERHEWREAHELAGAARRVERDEIPSPHPLDSVRDVLGEGRTRILTERVEGVAKAIETASDYWVETRCNQLGDPLKRLDREGARQLLRLERDIAIAEREVRRWTAKLPRDLQSINTSLTERGVPHFEATDPQLEPTCREVNHWFERGEDLQERLEAFEASGRHPGPWVAEGDRFARALAYRNEAAIRRELGLRQDVERSLVDPPRHVVDLIGATPARDASERAMWENVTREIEYRRLATEAALRDGLAHEDIRVRQPSSDLDRRIDQLRELRDMTPLSGEAAIDGPGLGR